MFRKEPNCLHEMLSWGMISYIQFRRVEHLTFEEAKQQIDGYQTWSFGVDHIMEYIKNYKVDVLKYTRNEWTRHCLALSKGRMCPNTPSQVYDMFKKGK